MINYEWKVTKLRTRIVDGVDNVVYLVGYECKASQEGKSVTLKDRLLLENPNSGVFLDYADITEDKALVWVKDSIVVADVESALQRQLEDALTVTKPSGLPWLV